MHCLPLDKQQGFSARVRLHCASGIIGSIHNVLGSMWKPKNVLRWLCPVVGSIALILTHLNWPLSWTSSPMEKENTLYVNVFSQLFADSKYGGKYYTLTEKSKWTAKLENVEFLNKADYQKLVESISKSMAEDSDFQYTGPTGRGVYVSSDRKIIVWVGEEAQLRIMSTQLGFLLDEVVSPLKKVVDLIEKYVPGSVSQSDKAGGDASPPTSIRASININLSTSVKDAEAAMEAKVLRLEQIKSEFPGNIGASCFTREYYNSLSHNLKVRLLQVLASGIANPDSQVGCYANQPLDYDDFRPFFNGVLAKYHKVENLQEEGVRHVNDWDLSNLKDDEIPTTGLDIRKLGITEPLSMRVRTARNLQSFPLPASMNREQRLGMEKTMYTKVFSCLFTDSNYGGKYYTLTEKSEWTADCDKVEFLNEKTYQELVDAHIMFKSMVDDSFLYTAGISRDWPAGRGVYVSTDRKIIVWVGEEDHLRIMSMKKGFLLDEVFTPLKTIVDLIEKYVPGGVAKSDKYGVVTSCPTNIGTGMRASVHIKLPFLTGAKSGSPSDAEAKKIAREFGLSVRGLGGEHTAVGADGTVDVSPSARFMISENQIIGNLYKGIKKIYEVEKQKEEEKA